MWYRKTTNKTESTTKTRLAAFLPKATSAPIGPDTVRPLDLAVGP